MKGHPWGGLSFFPVFFARHGHPPSLRVCLSGTPRGVLKQPGQNPPGLGHRSRPAGESFRPVKDIVERMEETCEHR